MKNEANCKWNQNYSMCVSVSKNHIFRQKKEAPPGPRNGAGDYKKKNPTY